MNVVTATSYILSTRKKQYRYLKTKLNITNVHMEFALSINRHLVSHTMTIVKYINTYILSNIYIYVYLLYLRTAHMRCIPRNLSCRKLTRITIF